MRIRLLVALASLGAAAFPLLAGAQSVGASNTTSIGGGVSTTTSCSVGSTAGGGGSTGNNTLSGGASVGSGATCSNSIGYADPHGYAQLDTSCTSGSYANAQGVAGAGGLMLCADASTGSSCSVGISGGGMSNYGGGGGSAGVSGGAGEGAGFCGGFTFANGSVNIQYCGSLAYDVGVDFCLNGSVNYANIINRMEPFASRAVAQAAKCTSSNTAAANCVFTTGDLMANAAGPYYRRAKDFFDANNKFVAGPAVAVWTDARSVSYRTANYAKSAAKYTSSGLTNTYYTASGQVMNAANQIVDVGNITKSAATKATEAAAKAAYTAAKDEARKLAAQSTSAAKKTFDSVGNGLAGAANSVSKGVVKVSGGSTAKVHTPSEDEALFHPSVFNWDYYYDTKGTAWGKTDLFDYWKNVGYPKGEQASNEFNLNWYRSHNKDTGKTPKESLVYWPAMYTMLGYQGSETFSLQAYRNRYSDLKNYKYDDLMTHWLEHGRYEGRNGKP
ncbi:MAG: hypothetical protein ABW190_08670 [Rhizobacter sp.]